MNEVLKKFVCVLTVLILIFGFSVSADEEFFVYGTDNLKICEILKMSEQELQEYCKNNNIIYFAVNKDNTKQIRKSAEKLNLSGNFVNLSALKDNEILELTGSLSRFDGANGKVVKINGQKYLKTELKTSDSGGEYIITEFSTVSDSIKQITTFYTAENTDRDYIDLYFEKTVSQKNYKPLFIAGIVLFSGIGIAVSVLIIKEIRKRK